MMIDEYYTFKIFGYHSDDLSCGSGKRVVAVCDECGLYRSLSMDQYSHANGLCKSCSRTGERNPFFGKHHTAESKNRSAEKEPLPDGWKYKLSDITNNKSSATYLGIMAEVILSNIYDSVRVMPYGNHGFDVICNRDFKIDIKAAATGDKSGCWLFHITKNQIADYFLCIAFNSRDDLHNPVHLWLIPAYKINHLANIAIYKTTVYKWSRYELPLDKLQTCCKSLKHD